ncbi:MAG: hypothetical protein ABSG31_06585 [Tepidisphaeraceae bacterium]|jgi:hypothetical protein
MAPDPSRQSSRGKGRLALSQLKLFWMGLLSLLGGCALGPHMLPVDQQKTIDRTITEYPAGFVLQPYVVNLDAPSAICWDDQGNLIIAESGTDNADPHIFGIRPDGKKFNIYPLHSRLPVISPGYHLYGPIGGMVFNHANGKIYVSHRDKHGLGAITALGYDGSHTTIVGDLPTQGDYSVTDLTIYQDEIYFGLGSATNSGVVGMDNYEEGWVRDYPNFCDLPYKPLKLLGYRFQTPNPQASIFSPDTTDTVPFEPLGISDVTHIDAAPLGRATGAIYTVSTEGGDCRVVGWGVRNPAGLIVDEFGRVYFTDQGMEERGTRPIHDDPDVLFHLVSGEWYGFPDFSRTLDPVSDSQYQPPQWMVLPTKYPDVGFVVDHKASDLHDPDPRWVQAAFKPLSGASKMDFVPQVGPFQKYFGKMVVALWGDRAPFATSNQPLKSPPPGYKVVLVDKDVGDVSDFVFNTEGGPASQLVDGGSQALERPVDVKFSPYDHYLYIVDFGRIRMKNGEEKVADGTGKILRLLPPPPPTTRSSTQSSTAPTTIMNP